MKQELNLLPRELWVETSVDWRRLWPGLVLAVLAALFIVTFSGFTWQVSLLEARLDKLQADGALLKPVEAQVKKDQEKIKELEKERDSLAGLTQAKVRWHLLLKEINAVMPPEAWMVQVAGGEEGNVSLQGQAADMKAVAVLVYELNRLPAFASVTLVKAEWAGEKEMPLVTFELAARLN